MRQNLQLLAERLLRDGTVSASELTGIDLEEFLGELHSYHKQQVQRNPFTSANDHTERQQADHAVREENSAEQRTTELTTAILDALPAHIALLDSRGKILIVNEAWKRFAQNNHFRGADYGVGTNYLEICQRVQGVEAEAVQSVVEGLHAVLAGTIPEYVSEYPCHSAEVFRWFRLIVTPVKPDRFGGVVVMHVDITSRKTAELENQKLIQDLHERVKELQVLHSIAHVLRASQEPIAGLFQEVVSILPKSLQFPSLGAALLEIDQVQYTTPDYAETPWTLESRLTLSNGTSVRIQLCYLSEPPISDKETFLTEERRVLDSVVEMLHSFLEARSREAQLAEREREFQLLFQNNPHPMWVYDLETLQFLAVNDTAVVHYGYEREEFLAMSIAEIRPPEDVPLVLESIKRATPDMQHDHLWRHLRKSGQLIRADIYSNAIVYKNRLARLVLAVDVTTKIEAEEALRESEERFRAFMDNCPAAAFVKDAEGRYQYVNLAWLRQFEQIPLHWQHKTDYYFWPKPTADAFRSSDLECLNTSKILQTEENGQLLNGGDNRSWLVMKFPINSKQGRSVGGMAWDITDRKRAETALQESEERLRLALSASRMGTFDWNLISGTIIWSPTHYEIFGYPTDDLFPVEFRHFSERLHPEDKLVIDQKVREAISHRIDRCDFATEARVILPDGSIRWIMGTGVFHYSPEGQAVRMIGTTSDITDRVRMEEIIRTSEAQLRAMFDGAATGIAVTDRQGGYLRCNDAYCDMLGYTQEELCRLDFLSITHPEDREHNKTMIDNLFAGSIPQFTIEKRCIHRSGRMVWSRAGVSLVRDRDGEPLNIIAVVEDVSRRKLAEEELWQSQERLRMASRLSHVGAWQVNVANSVITWSEEVYAIFGLPVGYPISLAESFALYVPEHQGTLRKAFERCHEVGTDYDLELEIVSKSGKRRWVRIMGEAVRDSDQRVIRVQGAYQDISEVKQAQSRLMELATRLTQTLESISDGFVTLDQDWRFLFVNQQAAKMLRRTPEQLFGKTMWEEFPGSIGSGFEAKYRQAMEQKETVHYEDFFAPLESWFSLRIYPMPTGLAVYFQDITQQKIADESIRLSEERFRLLAKATNDAIWNWNLITGKIWLSEGFTILFGYHHDEVENRIATWQSCIHPEEVDTVLSDIRSAIEGDQDQWSGEYRFRRKNGAYAHVLDRGYIIRDHQGRGVRMIGGMTDITHVKAYQEELARSNKDLQQFAYVASHDLQEPLRAVSGCVQLLNKRYSGQLDNRADELIKHTVEGVERMQKLINDLLEYSRVNTRGRSLQRTSLNTVLQIVFSNLEMAIQESKATVTHDVFPEVWADSGLLTILFQNLISNAIKFRGPDTPKIHLGAVRHKQEWLLSVQDNGIGMEQKYFDRVFVLFQRLHTRNEYPGTGIGLAICKKIVERHNGRIWIESSPGKGSTFYIALPDLEEPVHESGESKPTS